MSAYEALAASYDALTYDIPYDAILAFFEKLLARHHVKAETVVDLACGTGSLSLLLAEKGYRVIGCDLSPDMLTQASRKADQLKENRPVFVCQPMQRLRVPEPVDAVICCLDSINYLQKPSDCAKTFQKVFSALRHGGLFVFDINTPFKLKGLDGQVFLDETEDTYCVWRTEFHERSNLCYYGMDLFQKGRNGWQRSFEEHVEYAYGVEQLRQYLTDAGFSSVHAYGDCLLRAPKADEQRIYFAAKKE